MRRKDAADTRERARERGDSAHAAARRCDAKVAMVLAVSSGMLTSPPIISTSWQSSLHLHSSERDHSVLYAQCGGVICGGWRSEEGEGVVSSSGRRRPWCISAASISCVQWMSEESFW